MHSVDEDDEDDDLAKKTSCFLRHSEWGMHNSRMIQARSPTSWPTAKICDHSTLSFQDIKYAAKTDEFQNLVDLH